MKKFIMGCLTLLTMLASVAFMAGTASAEGVAKPPGVKLVLASECKINFEASVYWTGSSEDTVFQILWLTSQLPEKCLERKCVYTNIEPDWFLRLIRRFLEEFEDDPKLVELGTLVTTAFKDCALEANPRQSIVSTGGSGSLSCGGDGNTLILTVSGSNNTFSSNQVGCNFAHVQLTGTNITVRISQVGQNTAVVNINGNDITFTLDQSGQNTYNNNFNAPGVYHASQSN